jgi:hypothetical protein
MRAFASSNVPMRRVSTMQAKLSQATLVIRDEVQKTH